MGFIATERCSNCPGPDSRECLRDNVALVLFRHNLELKPDVITEFGKDVSVVFRREPRSAIITCRLGGRGNRGMMLVFQDQE